MKKNIYTYFAKKFAAFYIAYLEPAIQSHVLNIQKKNFKYLGNNVVFKGGGEVFHEENIEIFDNVQIGRNYFLMGIGGIEIGEGTIISRNVCLHSGNHNYKSNDLIPYDNIYDKRKIIIGKGVWIGQNVSVLPGIIIGDGAIIGMNVCVSKNVMPGEILVGAENRILDTKRDMEIFNKLLSEEKFFNKEYSQILK